MKKFKNSIIIIVLLYGIAYKSTAQGVAINVAGNTADQSAILDVSSLNKGLLMPRMTTLERNTIASPAEGLVIYNTDCGIFNYYTGSAWVSLNTYNALSAPNATAASGITTTGFAANWSSVSGATIYYLDVATDPCFSLFVTGYNNLNIGNVTTYSVTGLTCNFTYYYRIRANNSCGTSNNSNTIAVSTSTCGPSCGSQEWMTANMDVGTMVNSTAAGSQQTNDGVVEKYCYNNVAANCATYGGLYEWAEAIQISYIYNTSLLGTQTWMTCDPCGSSGRQGICPAGYHIPTDLEWSRYEYCIENNIAPTGSTSLATFQTSTGWRGSSTAGVGPGDKMKVTSSNSPAWDGTNTSGFAALPMGYRYGGDGLFLDLGAGTIFRTATEYDAINTWDRHLGTGNTQTYRHGNGDKTNGFSVRCLKD